jgi:predicted RNase H-like HicB family nuclease
MPVKLLLSKRVREGKYAVRIFWSEEDKGYIAKVAQFPNFSAFGKTRSKALKETEIVVKEFIKMADLVKGKTCIYDIKS